MESLLPVIIQLVSGAVGGNAAGNLMKDYSLGPLGNSVAGILGGGIGGQLLGLLGAAAAGGDMDVAGIVGNLASGGIGGGVLMLIVGFLKKALAK